MTKNNLGEARVILAFTRHRVLRHISYAIYEVTEYTGLPMQAIASCCSGKYMSSGGYYFRYLHPDIEVTTADLNTLTLEEYDALCGVERRYRSVSEMNKQLKCVKAKRKQKPTQK